MAGIYTVNLPDIGEGVVEGEVISWLKNVGDPLKQDEPVVVVMTDKATVELPAPYPGTLAKQYFQPGEIAIKDKPLYDIQLVEETAPVNKHLESPKKTSFSKEETTASEKTSPPSTSTQILATPPVRKLAKDLGIDIHQIKGSGKDGRITKDDLKSEPESFVSTSTLQLPGDEETPIIGIRNLMAKKMSEANRIIPHFSYFEQVDATRLVQMRENFKGQAEHEGIRITYMPFFIRALSLTVKKFPVLNSSLDLAHNKMCQHKPHHIGIAMASTLGLIVPVLKNVQDMTLHELIKAYEAIKAKAQNNQLQSSDMKESTITISNFGVFGGGQWATPIINYPEVAILAVARIQKQPMVKNNEIVASDVLHLSWSFDHRIIDGEIAASSSHYFATLIRDPAHLL